MKRADFETNPVSICVLAFSSDHSVQNDHFDLIRSCLTSLQKCTDPSKYRLHIGCNNLSPRVMQYIDQVCATISAVKIVGTAHRDRHHRVVFPKYPLMAKLFERTVSPWVVWLDDDTKVIANDWLEELRDAINRNPRTHQFGKTADVPLMNPPSGWIENSVWRDSRKQLPKVRQVDGSERILCHYIVGGFYAISREAIDRCHIPDPRLFHNGGDWTTGLALYHQGFDIAHHTYGVAINTAPRRGMHNDVWVPANVAARCQEAALSHDAEVFQHSDASARQASIRNARGK